mmetsp:Transcript_22260/g.29810  ORF Transcript_22260/g.29810 Transcript_22260/m.29810 type:complete len:94 (+) Transcript_22260:782-1063(+)
MIEKEKEEIKQIKAQVQKKNESMSKSCATPTGGMPASGAQANQAWEDNPASSGKKFKFIHVIAVSIVFLLLGSYLAKVPLTSAPVADAQVESE